MNKSDITDECLKARDIIINNMQKQLEGPGAEGSIPDAEHEIITDIPSRRYSCGILYPQKVMLDLEDEVSEDGNQADEVNGDGDEGETNNEIDSNIEPSGENQDDGDDTVDLRNQWRPSSMGITFFVKGKPEAMHIHLTFGTYRVSELKDYCYPCNAKLDYDMLPVEVQQHIGVSEDKRFFTVKEPFNSKWVRHVLDSYEADSGSYDLQIPLMTLARQCSDPYHKSYVRIPHALDFQLPRGMQEGFIDLGDSLDDTDCHFTAFCKLMDDDEQLWSITLMVSNEFKDFKLREYNRFIFQPHIKVRIEENDDVIFFDRNQIKKSISADDEEERLNLLYRKQKDFGSGMGTSLQWQIDEKGKGFLINDFLPKKELPGMDFNLPTNEFTEEESNQILSMKVHSDLDSTSKEKKLALLSRLVESYAHWIKGLDGKEKELPERYRHAASLNLTDCREAAARMKEGIALLRDDDKTYTAFSLANRAMFMQRVHLEIIADEKYGTERYGGDQSADSPLGKRLSELADINQYRNRDVKDKHLWRPFQLAFLLMSLKGIVDEKSSDRDLVDLIWFPTGGGKTEAYLGLSAFVIFYRRLVYGDKGGGTNIIMRYTLRLLTAQQFSRAATLICACEAIRKTYGVKASATRTRLARRKPGEEIPVLGNEPITIGLWIGSQHTPNRLDDAKKKLKNLMNTYGIADNDFQLLKCPWCGTSLVKEHGKGEWGYFYQTNPKHFYYQCPQDGCRFHTSEIPVMVIDEEIYKRPPTLLIGTVDKFAMMTWKNEVNKFFGADGQHRGPELIIQDELHLISGPLGSIVGLYETAIDYMCNNCGHVKPKIIASTATIRRAKAQCAALYNRDTRQFPPPGIDADDSYFARNDVIDHDKGKYGRCYIGVMASGKNQVSTEVTVISDLLQLIKILKVPDEVKDEYWTLTAYFNSLKDLGQCESLVADDIKNSVYQFSQRLQTKPRYAYVLRELTSRVKTNKLNQVFKELEEIKYHSDDNKKTYPVDIVLSSNMLSVGVDIARLNVLLMVNQPKLNSEYIQATSRVGRAYPGLVFTLYNQGRNRDQSYYEQFKTFHESFYRFVEPTGATPFSKPARDRALHAVLIAMMRSIPALAEEKSAGEFRLDDYRDAIERMSSFILDRVRGIRSRGSQIHDDIPEIKQEIEDFFEDWNRKAEIASSESKQLVYGNSWFYEGKEPQESSYRLLKPFHQKSDDKLLPGETLTSMRNIDSEVRGCALIWKED
ncbi:helicase-related protein [uncultured Megasphaera sp.]|uniref:helicase-related protein n=2 Tax=uncultured Megasphaera sp. TaxID=165188 RepID=UPI0025DDAD30|nr:helicase-related protein [uncultured Megasphaera sp.]